jgi:hypothetical protein
VEQTSHQVHVKPGEIEDLSLSHSTVDRHRDDSLYPFLTFKFLEQPSFFVEGQITCPSRVRAKLPNSPAGIAVDQFGIEGQREDLSKRTSGLFSTLYLFSKSLFWITLSALIACARVRAFFRSPRIHYQILNRARLL